MVPKTVGYSRKSYPVIESFDLKEAVFATLILLVVIITLAASFPLLNKLHPQPDPGNTSGGIPIPIDSIIKVLPPPPPIDPKNKFIPEPLPEVIKSPTLGRIVLVPNDSVPEGSDLTNNQALNYYAQQNGINDTMLKHIIPDTAEHLPDPGVFVAHDKLPVSLSVIKPVYPSICAKMNAEGIVMLNVLVDKNGNVARMMVLKSSGYEALDAAAMQALKEARFNPAMQGDKPVAVWVSYPVVFKLN
jgi:TonB family protein